MSYLVLARKYRPLDFSSVSGQEHVTRTLSNAIARDKISHAYLFAGPRGVGKTSVARIFSKALNCKKGVTSEPCLECENCLEISKGTNLCVREIDGASHNSVDNVRELIETFRALPPPGSKYKVYIIDEVHMLSTAAFNALLKSLEEPPPNTVFILATTEAHKIPDTVISRCQRHEFRALTNDAIEARLAAIATEENLKVESGVFRMIARISDGSMRDAQSLLDRVQVFCEDVLTVKECSKVLGVVERELLFSLSEAIFARDSQKAIYICGEVFSTGVNTPLFLKEFVSHWRELLIAKMAGEHGLDQIGVPKSDSGDLLKQVSSVSSVDLQDLVRLAREGADSALRSTYPKYAFESLVIRMAYRENVKDLTEIIQMIRQGSPPSVVVKNTQERAVKEVQTGAVASGMASWSDFVQSAAKSIMLAEHLKRLSISKFAPGFMIASGPALSVKCLQDKDNMKNLIELLHKFSGKKDWRIELTVGANNSTKSIKQQEEYRQTKNRKEQEEDIARHPGVQKLQKVFPGSKIENIKLKTNG